MEIIDNEVQIKWILPRNHQQSGSLNHERLLRSSANRRRSFETQDVVIAAQEGMVPTSWSVIDWAGEPFGVEHVNRNIEPLCLFMKSRDALGFVI
ncbi:hypothetical protein L596_005219 [Steinernema carpocapsae]|uniref:Uncharacterized protein n=1 Tax=Steinernema carpocapsae TaxID=34508 RepID=A0A4U8V1X8_STECR|nr:hypothetical protein L596_005219 [Steinernema carpocapsae]